MKHCPVCTIFEILERQCRANKKMRRAYEQSVCAIVRNKILAPMHIRLSLYCSPEHFEHSKLLRSLYDANGKDAIKNQAEQIKICATQIELCKEKISHALIFNDELGLKTRLCMLQKLTQRIKQHQRWLFYFRNRPDVKHMTSFDIEELLRGNKPAYIKISDEQNKRIIAELTEAARSYRQSERPSVVQKLTKHVEERLTQEEALRRIEANEMDTDGFDFSSLDSDFSATEGTEEDEDRRNI